MFTKKTDCKSLLETEQKKNEMLEKEMKDLKMAYAASKSHNAALQKNNDELSRNLNRENSELKKKIREQSAADLLLNALEAVGIIKKDPPQPLADYQLVHRQQMAGLQDYGSSWNPGALGQIFGL